MQNLSDSLLRTAHPNNSTTNNREQERGSGIKEIPKQVMYTSQSKTDKPNFFQCLFEKISTLLLDKKSGEANAHETVKTNIQHEKKLDNYPDKKMKAAFSIGCLIFLKT